MSILNYKFHYDYIKNTYDNKSRLFFTENNSLMYQIKTEDAYEDFHYGKDMFDCSKFKLKPNMCSFLVHDCSEHKKVKGVNKNDVTKIGRNKYKDVLLNKKSLRYAMNRIKIKIIK